ncbi:hypothetical protein D3C84_955420 [compost metagenome]
MFVNQNADYGNRIRSLVTASWTTGGSWSVRRRHSAANIAGVRIRRGYRFVVDRCVVVAGYFLDLHFTLELRVSVCDQLFDRTVSCNRRRGRLVDDFVERTVQHNLLACHNVSRNFNCLETAASKLFRY